MKRVLFVWMLCSIISLGSFGTLLAEDLGLGLPLPYSVPLAFAATSILVAMLQLLTAAISSRRTIVGREAVRDPTRSAEWMTAKSPAPSAEPAPVPPPAPQRTPPRTQGVVLFDLSRVPPRRQAA
jgi:hypothetical protein